jgi:hypothetical protein
MSFLNPLQIDVASKITIRCVIDHFKKFDSMMILKATSILK